MPVFNGDRQSVVLFDVFSDFFFAQFLDQLLQHPTANPLTKKIDSLFQIYEDCSLIGIVFSLPAVL